MIGIIHDNAIADEGRRFEIFDGNILLQTGRPRLLDLCAHADALIGEAFGSIEPRMAQYELAVPDFVARVAPLKGEFTNGMRTRQLMQQALVDLGCDPDLTFFDLPRLRVVPAGDYLKSGVSYAYAAHRDTWYAHPRALVNFWMPVYAIGPDSAMSMFPTYFDRPMPNHSEVFDYRSWVANERFRAANLTRQDTRPHPLPDGAVDPTGEFRIAGQQGDAMVFSGHHLHASAPNQSGSIRFSIDFRTVHQDDVRTGRGPDNVDNFSTGTTLPDFLRVSDLTPFDVTGIDLALAHPPPRHPLDREQVA